jgi:hypothetical protein
MKTIKEKSKYLWYDASDQLFVNAQIEVVKSTRITIENIEK